MKKIVYPLLVTACIALTACGTSETQSPIEDRSVSGASSTLAATPVGYHRVAKGETLYRISRTYGQSVADLVAWNSLNNANEINEGQLLRVVPQGEAPVQTESVTSASDDAQPVAQSETVEQQSVADGATREVSGVVWSWPTSGKVVKNFSDGQKGVDIAGASGQQIFAAADGRVIYSGTMSGYGNLIIVKHNDDLLTAYAHNKTNHALQGSNILRGQQIAEMGNTGTDSVKLHFEVRRQGKPVDPLGYLPQR